MSEKTTTKRTRGRTWKWLRNAGVLFAAVLAGLVGVLGNLERLHEFGRSLWAGGAQPEPVVLSCVVWHEEQDEIPVGPRRPSATIRNSGSNLLDCTLSYAGSGPLFFDEVSVQDRREPHPQFSPSSTPTGALASAAHYRFVYAENTEKTFPMSPPLVLNPADPLLRFSLELVCEKFSWRKGLTRVFLHYKTSDGKPRRLELAVTSVDAPP